MEDWRERARHEAAAILAEVMPTNATDYSLLVEIVAIGWLQGVNFGSHETLGLVERSFGEMRESL